MFKKLFGGSSGAATAQPAQAALPDPSLTIERLENQCETIEKRIKVMENKIKDAKASAVTKKRAGDQRGAIMAMKNMKMYEGELTKLDGQQIMLEQQKMTIISTVGDHEVIKTLITGNEQIKQISAQVDVNDIDDIMEELAEQEQERLQRNQVFADFAEEGKEELLEELDQIEAEALAGEITGTVVNSNPIVAPASAVEVDPLEAELAALRSDMAAPQLNAV